MKNKKALAKKGEGNEPVFWDPFREIDDVNDALGGFFTGLPFAHHHHHLHDIDAYGGRLWVPAIDVKETRKEYLISAELPGLDKKDLGVDLRDGVLTLSGRRGEEGESNDDGCLRRERHVESFQRSFVLPEGVKAGGVRAAYKDGKLKVVVPKSKGVKPTAKKVSVS